jgi:hypothetical protein
MPLFTMSRGELYDYLRCPKIVSIKAYRSINSPEEEVAKATPRRQPEVPASVVGKMGELAVAAAFSPAAAAALSQGGTKEQIVSKLRETVSRQTESTITSMGVTLDGNAKSILEETVQGLSDIRSYITEEFGELNVIGRGECRNGPFPGEALPDFVAITPKHVQPILIEVKNTAASAKTDRFQAEFYNTVARETGVVVHEQRFEAGKLNLVPVAFHQSIADTLLVYPRGGTYERITDQVSLKEDTLEEVWLAKQLGYIGRSPYTDCGSKCPHHRLHVELPEGNLEVSPPMPLIFAKGVTELGADLDAHYLHHYFYKSGIGSEMWEWVFKAERDPRLKAEVIKAVSSKMKIPEDVVEKMVFSHRTMPDPDKVMKHLSNEMDSWEKLLGPKRMRYIGPTLQGLVTKLYGLPDRSDEFVKRSRKKWK